jgi:2-dehydro-3-deoxyphosphogluconate aldolase/(4S)-4-hydroxy-2-oxoglutarate aldolase
MEDTLQTILETGIVAIIRSDSPAGLIQTVRALSAGGVRAIEVTMTTPGALEAISAAAGEAGDEYIIGAGSVLDGLAARRAILAGAEFLVAPTMDLGTIRTAKRYGKVVCPGALSPTEAVAAWEAGADIIKIFPASMLGPAQIQALAGPLPQVRYLPVGGVNLDSAAAFIRAGACALGVGGSLVNSKTIAAGDWDAIAETARRFIDAVASARGV